MKILLVEDSRVLRETLRRLIADIPGAILIGETDNEGDAIHYLITLQPDIVVLDLKLKGGSGLSLLEHIKAKHPDVHVVVLTNYGQHEYQSRCMALGADHFFDKSQDIENFLGCLSTLAQGPTDAALQPNHGVAP